MASGKGNYLNDALLAHIFNATSYSPPTDVDIALYTSVPNAAGGGTEVSGGSYARQVYPMTDWTAVSGQLVSNTSQIDFPTATSDWGTVVAMAIFESGTSNLMYWGNLANNRLVKDGDSVLFAVNALVIGES